VAGYSVYIKPSAVKELDSLPAKPRKAVARKIQDLANDPRPTGCEKLSTLERYRIRQGWYRLLYSVDDDAKSVLIVKIAHRREVYVR
jgi:mRNA interferase RelE/StbE